MKNANFQSNTTNGNNYRGKWGGYNGWWDRGGQKHMWIHAATFNYQYSDGNYCQGLWWDTDNMNVLITNATSTNNQCSGFFFEASSGPITVSG